MKFHDYASYGWDWKKPWTKDGGTYRYDTVDDFYIDQIKKVASGICWRTGKSYEVQAEELTRLTGVTYSKYGSASTDMHILAAERGWWSACRPYFKVWPSIVNCLLKLKLDIPVTDIRIPVKTFVARFPCGEELANRVESVFIGSILTDVPTIVLTIVLDKCVFTPGPMKFVPGRTLEHFVSNNPMHNIPDGDLLKTLIPDCLRLAVTLLLLADDPSIIEPDVLSKDELKFERTKDQKYVDKAHRRGKVGWHIGKTFESIPHYRRPHPALYHVGKGRKEQRIVFRAGSIVHRDKMTKVPTGYITPEGVEVEPE